MASINVVDLDIKKGFVTVRVGSIYLQFQRTFNGGIASNKPWRHSRGKLTVPRKDFLKAREKAAEKLGVSLNVSKSKRKPQAQQLEIDF